MRRRIYFPADEVQPRVNDAVIALIAIGCAAWAISFGWCIWSERLEPEPEPEREQRGAAYEQRLDDAVGYWEPMGERP